MNDGVLIGIDIGGTKTHAAAFDHDYKAVADVRRPTAIGDPATVGAMVTDTIVELGDRIDGRRIDRIGIGIPGLVDRASGLVRQAVNLGIGDHPLDLAGHVASVSSAPCEVDNDVNVAALGARQLLDPDRADLAYLSIGTGIAAGVILDGRLHRGRLGVAGEIGHFPFDPDGPPCECGLRGCLEAVASGSAIARQWPATNGGSPGQALIQASADGDDRAKAVLDPVTDYLARAVYLLAVTYDVTRIVIGGGVADLGQPLLREIMAALDKLATRSGFVRSLELPSRVMLKPPGPVGAVGAAALAAGEGQS